MKKIFRNVVERSCMNNNDEWVFYSDHELKFKDPEIERMLPRRMFDDTRLVVSRPVFDIEITEGLDIKSIPSSLYDSVCPKITAFLDTVFELKNLINFFKEVYQENDKTKLVNFLIRRYTCDFYDCMSGGLGKYEGYIVKQLVKSFNIDLSMELYPKGDSKDHYTIGDFMNEFKDVDISDIADILNRDKSLPTPVSMLED